MTKEEFFNNSEDNGVNDWSNHRRLLWYALEATQKGPVLEMGCGHGSTAYLHYYCEQNKRKLFSLETDTTYLKMFEEFKTPLHKFFHVEHWGIAKTICPEPSVVLIDHAPGYRRIFDVARFEEADILVCHDTQPAPTAADYGYEKVFQGFKYVVHLQVHRTGNDNRTWASALSNKIDVTQWRGLDTGNPDYAII
jgi:hypothetical protein